MIVRIWKNEVISTFDKRVWTAVINYQLKIIASELSLRCIDFSLPLWRDKNYPHCWIILISSTYPQPTLILISSTYPHPTLILISSTYPQPTLILISSTYPQPTLILISSTYPHPTLILISSCRRSFLLSCNSSRADKRKSDAPDSFEFSPLPSSGDVVEHDKGHVPNLGAGLAFPSSDVSLKHDGVYPQGFPSIVGLIKLTSSC